MATIVEKKCMQCGNNFESIEYKKRKYCSLECSHESIRKSVRLNCMNCGKQFIRSQKRAKNRRYFFCCRVCFNPKLYNKYGLDHHCFKNNKSFREAISIANRHAPCYFCKETKETVVHHKDRNPDNNILDNFLFVCDKCHGRLHAIMRTIAAEPDAAIELYKTNQLYLVTKRQFSAFTATYDGNDKRRDFEHQIACRFCKKIYAPWKTKKDSHFCSLKCRNAAHVKRIATKCDQCGKDLLRSPSSMQNKKHHFCSKQCKYYHKRLPRILKECKTCKKEFYITPSQSKQGYGTYCSWACRSFLL